VEDEDRKRRTRERERLLKERTSHSNRIKGLLHGQGVRDAPPLSEPRRRCHSKLESDVSLCRSLLDPH
jgi:transposase